jgi:hypothetical protein
MRAREFVAEARGQLADEITDPMTNTYIIPGLSAQDPYRTYRFGVAIAQARSEAGTDMPDTEFAEEGAFGENAVVAGFNDADDVVIDRALALTKTAGGKVAVAKSGSLEPTSTNSASPLRAFKGYPR